MSTIWIWSQIASLIAGVILGVVAAKLLATWRRRRWQRRREAVMVQSTEYDDGFDVRRGDAFAKFEDCSIAPPRRMTAEEVEEVLAFKPYRETPKL